MLRRRLLAAVPLVAIGAATALLVPQGSVAAASPTTEGKTYVALGDSYAAGYGLPAADGTPTGQPVAGCAQTTGDYPHLLASTLGLDLTDVTCSGARTVDFTNPQVTPAGTAAPQLDIFDTVQPDLVTITIGGNDLGFTTISANCLAATNAGPLFLHPAFDSCADWYTSTAPGGGAASNPNDKIAATVAKVDAAIKAVQAAAPDAEVAVIAYPAIAPDAANTPAEGCYAANALDPPVQLPGLPVRVGSSLPFTDQDVPFLQVLQQNLNEAIGAAATDAGAAYADIYPSSLAHSACEQEADRWVEPLIPGNVGGTNSLHPNLAGTTAMAAALAPVVEALFPAPPTTTPPTTTPPTTGSPSGATSGASTVAAGGAPLANTGTSLPVSWTLGLAALLLVAGGVALRVARPYRARH